jgi:hypothetical protein
MRTLTRLFAAGAGISWCLFLALLGQGGLFRTVLWSVAPKRPEFEGVGTPQGWCEVCEDVKVGLVVSTAQGSDPQTSGAEALAQIPACR